MQSEENSIEDVLEREGLSVGRRFPATEMKERKTQESSPSWGSPIRYSDENAMNMVKM